MNVSSHQHAVVGSNTEQGDKSYPDGYTQIDGMHPEQVAHIFPANGKIHKPGLSVKPQQNKSARECDKNAGKMYQRSRYRAKLEIKRQQDSNQAKRNNDKQTVGRPLLLFIIARKFVRYAGREFQFPRTDFFF